jgi:hypothetical protein
MILHKINDTEKRIEKVWYESSNILFSECDDKENELKTLRVTFKNGTVYEYYDVDVNDYLMFRSGGLENSQGKAFIKHIRPKYEYKKLGNVDTKLILEELEELKKKSAE